MNLDDAYRILEVEPGAGEDAVREARKTLAKVWHPDRHANDPALQKKAQDKLADVNAAFEVVDAAGFPAKGPKPPPKPEPPKAEPPKATPPKPVTPPPDKPNIEFVPARRVRWWVILVFAAALGVGAYLAITKLGASKSTPPGDVAVATTTPDASVVAVADAADEPPRVAVVEDAADEPVADAAEPPPVADAGTVARREKTFTLGSSRDDVIAAMGQPNGTSKRSSSINGVKTSTERLTYGDNSTVDFDGERVIGWSEGASPLHVRLDIHDAKQAEAAKARGTIKVGSGRDEVLGLLGPPTGISGTQWSYGTSTLELAYGKVTKIVQGKPGLPVAP